VAKTKAKKKPKEKRLRQKPIPGFEEPVVQEIEDAAEIYYDVMLERIEHSKAEDVAKDNLIDKMVAHSMDRYECDEFVVSVVNKKNVKV